MDLQNLIDQKQQRSADWSEKKQAEREGLMELLDSSIMDITSIPESYQAFLCFQASSGSRYSANNAALVLAQNPEATQVGTIEYWNKLGRKVSKGENGIKVMAPERYDYVRPEQSQDENGEVSTTNVRKRGLGFKMMSVFDVAQTTGKPLPELANLSHPENMEKALKALVDLSPVPLGVDNNLAGAAFYDDATMSITVNQERSSGEIFHALAREVTHAELHGGGKYAGYTREESTLYADSVAYLVSSRFGVEPPQAEPPKFQQVTGEFSGFTQEDRREVLDMLHSMSKDMGDRVQQEVGVPVHQRLTQARGAGAR